MRVNEDKNKVMKCTREDCARRMNVTLNDELLRRWNTLNI